MRWQSHRPVARGSDLGRTAARLRPASTSPRVGGVPFLLPDPRRLFGRVTESTLPTRVIAHIGVVSLVIVTSLAGLSQTQGSLSAEKPDHFLALVQSVRGAADQPAPTNGFSLETVAMPADEAAQLDRSSRVATAPNEPLASPVPVDPDATPLPGPPDAQATGSASTGQAQATVSTRVAAPPAPAVGGLVWPVPVGSVSQSFHAGHLAIDVAAPYGSQIVAAQGGTVIGAGWRNNGGGLVIEIDHGNGMRTVYNHLGSIWVAVGQYVGAGQGIGGVGCTGMCTGPHVHFEVFVNGVIDNPLRYY